MSWNNLSMKDKASYIRMGVENGITDLDTIREVYNKFAKGGNLDVNDNPKKRTYDHNEGVYYVEDQDAPNKVIYSLDEFTQEQINEINSKYNKGWKTDKKGNVIFGKYTGTPLNADLRNSFPNKEYYEHYIQKKPTPVGTKFKSNPSIVKAESMFKTVVRAMQRDSVDNSEDVTKRRNEEARKRHERTQQQNKEYNEEYKHRAGQFLDALALTSALGAIGTQIGASNAANKAMGVGMSTPEYNKLMGMSKNLDTANTIFEGIGMPIDIYQASEGFVNNDMKQALTNTYSASTPISKLIKVSNPKYHWLKPAISFTGNLMEPLSKIFKEGGPIKKSYKDFSTRLSRAWGNQDLSKDYYDYQKYYNDDPNRAYRQLESIEHGGKGHFPDGGKSGTYKTPNHPTYPDLGPNSWLNNDRIFNMSYRQANQGVDNIREEINTDRILDYLGSDLHYNNGATKAMYDGAYQLPSITVTPNGNYTELVPNELNTGWMYKDRAGRFDDTDYSYLDKYLSNKKSLGGNLYEDGDDNTPIEYTPSIDVYATPKQQADRLISLGKGVYKDKVSNKLLYNYDEMPTATVVGHKKKKSVNDNLQAAYDVDAIDLIFPKESRTFKEDLRKITNAGMNRWDMENPLSMDEVDAHNLGVNQQISDFLSSHGYSVGEYTNSNLAEKFPQSFSIFDRNAVHNWKRIKKLGGPIKTSEDGYPLYELPEVEVTPTSNYESFLNSLPQNVQQYLQDEARNNILAKQVGSIDNPGYGTISKEDAERNKRNYFDVQALNTAMGSPNVMNQNSFNYNPNIADKQLQYGSTYPISTINNAFETALGDAAFNYALTKGVPIALDKLGFFVQKPNSFTRGIGITKAGLRDLQKSGVVRGNPYGTAVTANEFAKIYRRNRSNFKSIIDATGDPSIAQKWFSNSLSKDEFNKLRNAEIKVNGEYKPVSESKKRFDLAISHNYDFVRQFDTYDDYLKHLEKTKRPTSVDDSGEALAYFYDDGRNPLTAGHDYAASNYGVRVNNASSYNPRIFEGHLHYSFPQAVKLTDPNVEVFRNVKLGPFNITRRMNKNNIIKGKFASGGQINTRAKHKNSGNSLIGLY